MFLQGGWSQKVFLDHPQIKLFTMLMWMISEGLQHRSSKYFDLWMVYKDLPRPSKILGGFVTSAVNSLLAFLERGRTKKRHETFNLLHTMGTE